MATAKEQRPKDEGQLSTLEKENKAVCLSICGPECLNLCGNQEVSTELREQQLNNRHLPCQTVTQTKHGSRPDAMEAVVWCKATTQPKHGSRPCHRQAVADGFCRMHILLQKTSRKDVKASDGHVACKASNANGRCKVAVVNGLEYCALHAHCVVLVENGIEDDLRVAREKPNLILKCFPYFVSGKVRTKVEDQGKRRPLV